MTAMLLKDLRLIARDRWAVLLGMLVPIAVISVIAAALLGDDSGKRLAIAVVDEDHGPVAAAFKTALSEYAEVVELTRDDAARFVRDRNRGPLAVVFPAQLSDNYRRGKPSEVLLLTDPAQETGLHAAKTLLLLMEKKAGSDANPLNRQLIELSEHNLTGNRLAVTPFEQNLPGFALMFILVAVIFGTSMALHDEADWRTLTRLLIAPASFNALVLGKLAARFIVGVVQFLLLLLWSRLAFGVSLGSSPAAVIVLVCAVVFTTVATGLVVAALTGSRQQVQPLGLAVVIALSGLGGLWWPPAMGPPWMETVSRAFYTTWAMRGLNDLVLRNRGLQSVGIPLAILVAYGAALLVVGLVLLRVRAGVRRAPAEQG